MYNIRSRPRLFLSIDVERLHTKNHIQELSGYSCMGLMPILESFPNYKTSVNFAKAIHPNFEKTKEHVRLVKHFTEIRFVSHCETKRDSFLAEQRMEIYRTSNEEMHLFDGVLHREECSHHGRNYAKCLYSCSKCGPAYVFYSDGKIIYARWYRHGVLHRLNGPACIYYSSCGTVISQEWYVHGRRITPFLCKLEKSCFMTSKILKVIHANKMISGSLLRLSIELGIAESPIDSHDEYSLTSSGSIKFEQSLIDKG